MMRVLGWVLVFLTVASCGSEDPNGGKLVIAVSPSRVALIPDARYSCVDIYQAASSTSTETTVAKSISGSSIGFASGQLTWLDEKRDLYIIKIQLDLENTIVGAKADITDQEELARLFGFPAATGLKVLRKGAQGATVTGFYRTDLKDFDNNFTMDPGQQACQLGFGGITAPEKTETTVAGQIRLLGITQDDAGNQSVVRASFPVSVIISTD